MHLEFSNVDIHHLQGDTVMVLVAKGELLSNKTILLFSYFLHDSGKVNHLFCSRIDLKIFHFIEVWWRGTEKY